MKDVYLKKNKKAFIEASEGTLDKNFLFCKTCRLYLTAAVSCSTSFAILLIYGANYLDYVNDLYNFLLAFFAFIGFIDWLCFFRSYGQLEQARAYISLLDEKTFEDLGEENDTLSKYEDALLASIESNSDACYKFFCYKDMLINDKEESDS